MSPGKTGLLLVTATLGLTVLLFISPRQSTGKIEEAPTPGTPQNSLAANSSQSALDLYLNLALKVLAPNEKNRVDQFKTKNLNDSLIAFWDKKKRPDLASYYTELKAKALETAPLWLQAGTRYYYAAPFVKDETELPLLYQRAEFCLNKSLQLDSTNNDARLLLANCLVESGSDPMKGIGLLKELERRDSNNVKVQLSLALFSVRSNQLDKAIERFNKVLRIDSSYIEAYLHLADAYEKLNQPGNSLKMLEKYQSETKDPVVKLEVGKYIEQLKNSN